MRSKEIVFASLLTSPADECKQGEQGLHAEQKRRDSPCQFISRFPKQSHVAMQVDDVKILGKQQHNVWVSIAEIRRKIILSS